MVDITYKNNTLRVATAQAIVKVSSAETIRMIQEDRVPKGNVLAMAKAAGFLGVKKTPDLLPDCHPLPIEYTAVDYEIGEMQITILMTVKTIYKTGVEVEAMHGASVVALTMYDMLKPVDKGVEISSIRLLEKKGGKSSNRPNPVGLTADVIVCSDSIAAGEKEDRAGKTICEKLQQWGIGISVYEVIPDEAEAITSCLKSSVADLIIYTGGTGVSPRDCTPDALAPLMQVRLEGVEEQMRRYGQERMPFAMLSRSLAGIYQNKVVLAVPGSTNGAREAIDAVFPGLLHVFHVLAGGRHD